MPHVQTAQRWGALPGFVKAVRHWAWCREALPALLLQVAHDEHVAAPPPVDMVALARAFWAWAATLEGCAHLEPLDPVDFAHFQAGVLVSQLAGQRVLRLSDADRSSEVRVITQTGLTLLVAWRVALGAEPPRLDLPEAADARWSSYVENVVEDPAVAVAFLDRFTGCDPVWRFPMMPAERPPLQRALEQRRAAG